MKGWLGVVLTVLVVATLATDTGSVPSFWDRYDAKYAKTIAEAESHTIRKDGDFEVWGDLIFEPESPHATKMDRPLDEAPTYAPQTLTVGSTFNWLTGAFGAPAIVVENKLRQQYTFPATGQKFDVPDHAFIVNTPEYEASGETEVYETINEYTSAKSKKFGLGLGVMGVALRGSREWGNANTLFQSNTVRMTSTTQKFTHYRVDTLPPEMLRLQPELVRRIEALPRFDLTTKQKYFDFFNKYSTHIVTSIDVGAQMFMEHIIQVSGINHASRSWITDQVGISFLIVSTPDMTVRAKLKEKQDPSFTLHETHTIRLEGGNVNVPFENWQTEWVPTITSNLTVLRYSMEKLSQFMPPSQARDDMDRAIEEYLALVQAENYNVFLGGSRNIAIPGEGAGVAGVSSIAEHCYKKCSFRVGVCFKKKTVCEKTSNPAYLIAPGTPAFQFNTNDGGQTAHIALGRMAYLDKVRINVPIPQTSMPTVITVDAFDGSWYRWGEVTNGRDSAWDYPSPNGRWPKKAQQLRLTVRKGIAPTGSYVGKVEAHEVTQSSPAAVVDSVTVNSITGWAFDAMDPTLALTAIVYNTQGQELGRCATGIDRPDVTSSLALPAGSRVGYSCPFTLPGGAPQRFGVYVRVQGLSQSYTSKTYELWNVQPVGKLLTATPSKLTSWVLPSVQTVVFLVNGAEVGRTNTRNLNDPYVNEILGLSGNNGIEAALPINSAGLHTVSAYGIMPDGSRRDFENTIQVDLRLPLGHVEEATAAYVTGVALDPNNPNTPATVIINVDGVYHTNGTTDIGRTDFNQMYNVQGTHGFNISVRIQGGKYHVIDTFVFVNGTTQSRFSSQVIAIGLDDPGGAGATNSIINFAGLGFIPTSAEMRIRVVDLTYNSNKALKGPFWQKTGLKNLPYPDQLEIQAVMEDTYHEETEVFRNAQEFVTWSTKRSGFGIKLGFFSFSRTKITYKYERQLTNETSRIALSDRTSTLFNVAFKPPDLLKLTPYVQKMVDELPEFNKHTRPRYFRFFDLVGTDWLSQVDLGGQISCENYFDSQLTEIETATAQKKQTSIGVSFFISLSGSFEKGNAERELNKRFLERSKWNFRVTGGHPELWPLEQSVEWKKTIVQNPGLVGYKLLPVHILVRNETKKAWLSEARLDFLRSGTPSRFTCNAYNPAAYSAGARVVSYSSIMRGDAGQAVQNVLSDATVRRPWSEAGDSDFVFGTGDTQQTLVVNLGSVQKIKAVSVEVVPYPNPGGVWDYIQVFTSVDNVNFKEWGSAGDRNGIAEIRYPTYEFPKLVAEDVQYIRYVFGGAEPATGAPSKVRHVSATACYDITALPQSDDE